MSWSAKLVGAGLVYLTSAGSVTHQASGPFRFEDQSGPARILGHGPTFGPGAWGDWNGDGRPDLWVGNHANHPQLFVNQGDGSFVDVAPLVWAGNPFQDTHGAAWADFDGDGDADLIELVGASGGNGAPNLVWVNEGGLLIDRAAQLGLDFPDGRGRTPLWADWDGDQHLDLFAVNLYRPSQSASVPFRQLPGPTPHFILDLPGSGYAPPPQATEFAHLADLTGDGSLDLIVDGSPYPSAVYDLSVRPMQDILAGSAFQGVSSVVDAAYADFNNDGLVDVYLCRDRLETESEVVLVSTHDLRARLVVRQGEEGFSVQSSTALQLEFPENAPLDGVRLGAAGLKPQAARMELDPRDPLLHGIAPHQAGVDRGVWIGFDPVLGRWIVLSSTPSKSQLALRLHGGPMRGLERLGWDPPPPLADQLLLNTGSGFQAGAIDVAPSSRSVVSGDFDNDLDLDLYVVRSGAAGNRPNLLLENQGDGSFRVIEDAGASGGASGAAGAATGLGDGVSCADFDQDGWLDLFLTNGFGEGLFAADGPHQLFRNRSAELHPDRHWLLVDLIGPGNNRDAVGAQVRVLVGGKVLLREQNGGVHRFGQNHMRLHFGLGDHVQVDLLEVRWPDGSTTQLGPVAADQVIEVQA